MVDHFEHAYDEGMDSTPRRSGDHPGEGSPRRDLSAPSGDVLEEVLARFGEVEAAPTARALLAQVLAATLVAFTRTRSVRDPLPDTAPESAGEALAVLAGVDHLRASLAAVDAVWQVAAEERIRRDDVAQGVPSSRQGREAGQEIALARRISPVASSFSRAKARRLVQNMSGSVDLLWSGTMTDQQASAVSGALAAPVRTPAAGSTIICASIPISCRARASSACRATSGSWSRSWSPRLHGSAPSAPPVPGT